MGWLREQIEKAHKSFQEWPDWMQDAARFEVSEPSEPPEQTAHDSGMEEKE